MWSTGTGNSRSSPCQLVRFATDCSAADPHLLQKGNTLQCIPARGITPVIFNILVHWRQEVDHYAARSALSWTSCLKARRKPCWVNTIQASVARSSSKLFYLQRVLDWLQPIFRDRWHRYELVSASAPATTIGVPAWSLSDDSCARSKMPGTPAETLVPESQILSGCSMPNAGMPTRIGVKQPYHSLSKNKPSGT